MRMRAPAATAWLDLGVVAALSVLAVLGFETSFGGVDFLFGALVGLAVGLLAAVAAWCLRWGVVPGAALGLLAYLLAGSLTMPTRAFLWVLPSPDTLAALAIGPVFGWADIVTIQAPVQAPYYVAVVPYFAAWLVGFVSAALVLGWLPRKRSALRAGVVLTGPVLLYAATILLGTRDAVLPGVRGVAFALIALWWLATAQRVASVVDGAGAERLRRTRLVGSAVVIVGAIVVGATVATLASPPPATRFVLRDEVVPPFDPVDFSSPLAGFRT
jgi:hypothetical protein